MTSLITPADFQSAADRKVWFETAVLLSYKCPRVAPLNGLSQESYPIYRFLSVVKLIQEEKLSLCAESYPQ